MIAGRKPAFSGKIVEGGLVKRSVLSAGAPSTKASIRRASEPGQGDQDSEQQQPGEDGVADDVAARLVAQHRRACRAGAGDGEAVARAGRPGTGHHS